MDIDFSTFDRIIERRGTGSLKWARYEDRPVLPMWVADMDFRAAEPIIRALQERVENGVFGYSVATAEPVNALCGYLQRVHAVEATPEWLVWMPGMVPGLAMSAACAGQRGDAVMTCTPVYPPFLKVASDAGKELITVPLCRENDRDTFDFDAMEKAVTPGTRLFLLCNPHNPVGRVYSQQELEKLADFCVRHELWLCSDEIHCDLLLEPETCPHFTCLKLDGPVRSRLVVLMAASKTYNVPGLGLSAAIIPDTAARRRFQAAKHTFVAETSPLGFAATAAAYSHCEPWRETLCRYLRRNRDTLQAFLAAHCPQVTMPCIEATYLAWLDVRSLGLSQPTAHFETHGLGLNNGADFGSPGFVRLNFGCPHSVLEEGLQRLGQGVRAARG